MEQFVIGLAIGGVFGAALYYFLTRKEETEPPEWADLLADQQGHIAELRSLNAAPRAVTKLTHRERTLEI